MQKAINIKTIDVATPTAPVFQVNPSGFCPNAPLIEMPIHHRQYLINSNIFVYHKIYKLLRYEIKFDLADTYGVAFLYTHFCELMDYALFAKYFLEVRH